MREGPLEDAHVRAACLPQALAETGCRGTGGAVEEGGQRGPIGCPFANTLPSVPKPESWESNVRLSHLAGWVRSLTNH